MQIFILSGFIFISTKTGWNLGPKIPYKLGLKLIKSFNIGNSIIQVFLPNKASWILGSKHLTQNNIQKKDKMKAYVISTLDGVWKFDIGSNFPKFERPLCL